MAYGEKYNLTFQDNKLDTWRIGIFKNGYAGASTGITGQGSPIGISWGGGSNLFTPMRASEATLRLTSTTNFQFSEFFTAQETDYILEVKLNGSMFWNGIYIPENYNEPYIDFPYPVTLRFQDGLAYLKKLKFPFAEYTAYSIIHIGYIIRNMLRLLPTPLWKDIVEIINIFESNSVDSATLWGMLWKIHINPNHFYVFNKQTERYEGLPAYSVLELLLHDNGLALYQWENKWYVFRVEEARNSSVNYFTLGSPAGPTALSLQRTVTNKDEGNPNELIWMNQSAELNITEKFSEIIATYKYGLENKKPTDILNQMNITSTDNATRNHSESWLESSALLAKTAGWMYYDANLQSPFSYLNPYLVGTIDSNSAAKSNGLLVDNNILAALLDTSLYITALENTSSTVTKKNFPHPITDRLFLLLNCKYSIEIDTLNFNIDIANEVDAYVALIYFKIKLGSYYLKNKTNGGYEWTTTDSIARMDINAQDVSISEPTIETMVVDFTLGAGATNLHTIAFPFFPINGVDDLTFTLYSPVLPKIPSGANDKIKERTNFKIELLQLLYQAVNMTIGEESITKNLITTDFQKILALDVFTGDGPHAIITGTYFVSQNVITGSWYYDEDIYTILSHIEAFILRPYSRFYNSYRKKITGTLYGNIKFYNTLIDNSVIYFINSMDYDIKKNEFFVDIEEVSGLVAGTISTIDNINQYGVGSTEFTNGGPKPVLVSYDDTVSTLPTLLITEKTVSIRINHTVTIDKDINDYPL